MSAQSVRRQDMPSLPYSWACPLDRDTCVRVPTLPCAFKDYPADLGTQHALVLAAIVKLIPLSTHLMAADALTKILPAQAHVKHRDVKIGHAPFCVRMLRSSPAL